MWGGGHRKAAFDNSSVVERSVAVSIAGRTTLYAVISYIVETLKIF